MDTIIGVSILVGFLALLFILFHFYIKFLMKMTVNSARKKVQNGRLNDKKLLTLMGRAYKGKNNGPLAFFIYGINYKMFIRAQEEIHDLYYAEAQKRNLV